MSVAGPAYSADNVSSLSPVSDAEECTFNSPPPYFDSNGSGPLVGELSDALDGGTQFVLSQCYRVRMLLRQHPLVIREVTGKLARDQSRSPISKKR
jgi:hypothetical protein